MILLAVGPVLLPALGVGLEDVALLVPAILLGWAATRCVAAARHSNQRRGVWLRFAAASALASVSSPIAVAASLGALPTTWAFYLGAGGSVAILA